MADVFGADVSESVRGTNALMEGFGLSAQEASDLMAAGMQRGLNYTDELGDNLSEYSVRWGEAGMSASQYFSLLEAGTANGAYNWTRWGTSSTSSLHRLPMVAWKRESARSARVRRTFSDPSSRAA